MESADFVSSADEIVGELGTAFGSLRFNAAVAHAGFASMPGSFLTGDGDDKLAEAVGVDLLAQGFEDPDEFATDECASTGTDKADESITDSPVDLSFPTANGVVDDNGCSESAGAARFFQISDTDGRVNGGTAISEEEFISLRCNESEVEAASILFAVDDDDEGADSSLPATPSSPIVVFVVASIAALCEILSEATDTFGAA